LYKAQKNFIRYVRSVSFFSLSHLPRLSHEVRTPLNTLSIGLDLLSSHPIFKILIDEIKSPPNSLLVHGVVLCQSPDPRNDFHDSLRIMKENQILDAREIIEEMKQSCEAAICTLNDVLLYDKIEEGTMVFEKRKISVRQLLVQTIKPFFIQVIGASHLAVSP
jgi:signal transduction histidine kinase